MPNVTFNAIASVSGGTGNFIASVISTNYNNVATVINSRGLDSDNYGASAILGGNIGHIAILGIVGGTNFHMASSAVVSQKLANNAVLHKHLMKLGSSNDLVRTIFLGVGAKGNKHQRYSVTYQAAAVTKDTVTVQFSDALDWGTSDSPFTETPVIAAVPAVQVSQTDPADNQVINVRVTNIDSVSAVFIVEKNTDVTLRTATMNFEAWGR